MYSDDSQTPSALSQLEQLYLNSQAPKRRELEQSIFFEIATSEQYKKMIAKLLQEEFVEAKDLEDASGLSRSAALNRAEKLVERGVLQRRIKPGTENRYKPPYIFFLDPGVKSHLAKLVQEKGAEREEQPKIEDRDQDLQLDDLQVSLTEQEQHQLGFSNEIVTNGTSGQVPIAEQLLDNAAERNQQATSKFAQESQSLEKRVGIVLTEMAKEIAALRSRLTALEGKLEQKAQDTDSFDFGQVLSILEPKQNGKDTT